MDPPIAAEVRSFVRAHISKPETGMGHFWTACVRQDDTPFKVFYDDRPDGEEGWPL